MAERRMFAKSIINSGRFLKMPPTSRLLYYDLGMMADDDGIVEAFSVMAQTHATEDDLRVLVAKGYIRILNEDLVSLICDWKTNNSIRGDRYHPSIYAELLELNDNGIPTDNQLTTTWQPNDNQMETEVRLGKDRIDKDNIKKKIKKEKVSGFDSIISEYTENENLRQTIVDFIGMRKAIKHQLTDRALKMTLAKLDSLSSTDEGKIKILEQSIFHSWQGVFPLKEEPEEQQTGDGIKWQ
jgi:hypothetical protein